MRLRAVRAAADQELAAARMTVDRFDEANRDLIQAVAAEVPVAYHQRFKAAYDGFLPEIQNIWPRCRAYCFRARENKPGICTTHSIAAMLPATCCMPCGYPSPRMARSKWSSPVNPARAMTR
ncbi:ATPase involved in DNA repair [Candidatus Burkholderia pumila]|uniref:ATPase involved in DNA repair n=1 Tax=Candidatus Burkholderia pumila TaxID=1090375 RepID=A0ABR5HJU4_9BURK|nr:ATPase involved in DNA repair [Candidatus Burkholderia pumila]